jgi:DNA-binding XRE family transcriptional regulator
MEWGASRILALRKHASMTQAQLAQWLGVTIKQVKYLEHQRRNPSGPTKRLLGILAHQLGFESAGTMQVLGASLPQPKLPARRPRPKNPSPTNGGAENTTGSIVTAAKLTLIGTELPAPASALEDEAFVWL